MRPVKRVLLASAAGIFAVAGAQAADLPVKAQPVEYVRVCSLYGAGFWYVPGTDTCIKIGAFVKLDTFFNADGSGAVAGGQQGNGNVVGGMGGAQDRATGQFNWRERAATSFDIRTQTEYGTLRSYINVGQQMSTNSGSVGGTASFVPTGNAANFGSSSLWADRAFLQFAGFTAGKMRSFFDLVNLSAYSLAQQRMSGDTSPNGIAGIAYTWQFGGGLSVSLSFEDTGYGTGGRGKSTMNLAGGGSVPATSDASTAFGIGLLVPDNKGQDFFDPVFNIRLDQSWGFVGASFALHDASGGYYGAASNANAPPSEAGTCLGGFTTCGHPGDKWGWAGSLGFTVVNPFGLDGDSVGAQGVYAVGATGYATAQWGAGAIYGSGNNVGLSYLVDGVYDNGTSIQLTKTWSANGFYEHVWNPKWRTSVYGGLVGTDFAGAKALICGNPASPLGFSTPTSTTSTGGQSAFVSGTVSNCNPNSSWSQLGTRTMWNPVPDLDVGFDVGWYHLNTAFAGTATLQPLGLGTQFQPSAGARPGGVYTISNQDVIAGFFRIQRNFLY